MKIHPEVRRWFTGVMGNGGSPEMAADDQGAQGISNIQGIKSVRAASGVRFRAVNGNGSTFLAPVTAMPTTTATMALWNGSSKRTLFIDKLGYFLASGTPTAGSALVCCVTTVAQARPTLSTGANGGYAGTVISGLGGQSGGNSEAAFVTNITITGAQPAWGIVAANPGGVGLAAATFPQHVAFNDHIAGGIAVPPGGMLGLAVLSGTGTTPLFGFEVEWDEYISDTLA